MVCVCINSCYLHADRGGGVCMCVWIRLRGCPCSRRVCAHTTWKHTSACVCFSIYVYINLCISMQYFIFIWVYFPYPAVLSSMESWCARKALGDA